MAAQLQLQQPQQLQQQNNPVHAELPASADAWGSDSDDDSTTKPLSLQLLWREQEQNQQQQWHGSHTKQHQQRLAGLLAQLPVRRQQQHQHWQQTQQRQQTRNNILSSQRSSMSAVGLAAQQTLQQQVAIALSLQHYHQQQQQQQQEQPVVPQLQALCLGVLGAHVSQLAQQLRGQPGGMYWLPADMKAALLAVARRRGELSACVLSLLADVEWSQLDLAGCTQLSGAQLLALAPLMPNIRVLDMTGFEQLSAGGWRRLARAWPQLAILRLGGSAAATAAALKALPHMLPGIVQPAAAAAAAWDKEGPGSSDGAASALVSSSCWDREKAYDVDADTQQQFDSSSSSRHCWPTHCTQQKGTASCSSITARLQQPSRTAAPCRLQQLRVLVWPDAPDEALQLVQQHCPRVLVNPVLLPDAATGLLPPAEVEPAVALDEPLMQLVAGPWQVKPQATGVAGAGSKAISGRLHCQRKQKHQQPSLQRSKCPANSSMSICTLATTFAGAASSEEEELGAESPTAGGLVADTDALRGSHVLRALDAWLDEV